MQKEREVTKIGRPKNRWEDDVRKDLQTMKIKNWKRSVLDRDLWKKIAERTKTHTELQRLLRRRLYTVMCRFCLSSCCPVAAFRLSKLQIFLKISLDQTLGIHKNNLNSEGLNFHLVVDNKITIMCTVMVFY